MNSWWTIYALAFIATFFFPFLFTIRFHSRIKRAISLSGDKKIRNMIILGVIAGFIFVYLISVYLLPSGLHDNFLFLYASLVFGTGLGYVREWKKCKKLNSIN